MALFGVLSDPWSGVAAIATVWVRQGAQEELSHSAKVAQPFSRAGAGIQPQAVALQSP